MMDELNLKILLSTIKLCTLVLLMLLKIAYTLM